MSDQDLTPVGGMNNHPISSKKPRPGLAISYLSRARLRRAKAGYDTRKVPLEAMGTLVESYLVARPGDLLLARVASTQNQESIGAELGRGRWTRLEPETEIILSYGNGDSETALEPMVVTTLDNCHIVAVGTTTDRSSARVRKIHSTVEIIPLGFIGDHQGHTINLRDWAPAEEDSDLGRFSAKPTPRGAAALCHAS